MNIAIFIHLIITLFIVLCLKQKLKSIIYVKVQNT